MLPQPKLSTASAVQVQTYGAAELATHLPRLEAYVKRPGLVPLGRHPVWLSVLQHGLGHEPCCLEAVEGGRTRGLADRRVPPEPRKS